MCVADWQVAQRMNLRKSDILAPALTVSVADNANLELMGAHFITLKSPTGRSTEQLVYFAKGVGEFYLSKSALIDLGVISTSFPNIAPNDSKAPGVGAINEVQDGFPSGVLLQVRSSSSSQRQVAPTTLPSCSSTPTSPCVPQGMSSLGTRPPRSAPMGGVEPQQPLTTKLNGSRAPPLRAGCPLVDQKVLDPPEVIQVRSQHPQPSHSLQYQQVHAGTPSFQVQQGQQGTPFKIQGNQDAGAPNKSQGLPKDTSNPQVNLGQVPPQVQDVGPDWEHDFPNYQQLTQGTGGSALMEVAGGFPSVSRQDQLYKVKVDKQGRELAPCGCLKRVNPLPPPTTPPCPIIPANSKKNNSLVP